jgi:hypothetical protein
MRDQAREVRLVGEHEVGREPERTLERELDIRFQVDHVEPAGDELVGDAARRRHAELVPARDELASDGARAKGAVRTVARDAVQDAHAVG